MKKHRSSTREALIDRFIANHNGGNVVEKYLAMSTKLTEEEMLFLRSLTTSDPFDKKMGTYRRTIDIIIDAKSIKKSISEVVPILRKYSDNQYTLSRESVAMITTNICAEALENYAVTYGLDSQRTHSLLLELHSHTDLSNLATVLKDLVTRNRFDTNNFKIKYFQMKNIPLEILWYFHCINVVRFPDYIYNIADDSAAVNHVKDCMVELLSSLYNGSDGDLKTTEDHMDVDEIPTTSNADITKFNQQADFLGQKREEIVEIDDNLWKFRKEMIKDLLTSLICVAQSKSSDMEIMKSNARKCNNILDDIFNKATDNILTTLLNSSRMQNLNESYLSLLLQIPTLSKDVLQTFLISHFVVILSYKPIVDCNSAISQQGNWTYSKCSAGLTSFIESILTGLQDSCLGILKDMIQKEEVNWKFVIICISTYLKCIPESGKNIKSLLDWLLNKAFLNQDVKYLTATFIIARQCCLEGCSPAFSSYITWFGTTFGPESPWANRNPATQHIFEFFIQFLTSIVPYEPPACLKVHINKAPTCPPNTHSLLMDYITLAKTRLRDLNEAPGFGVFGPELTTEQDIERALRYFETHNGEIAQTLLDASLFRRQHFEQEFLGKLLTTKFLTSHVVQDIENTKNKFITKLYNMGKIPHTLFIKYQEECSTATRAPDPEFVDSPELFEVLPDPVEQFHTCLTNLSDCVRGLSHYWETQRFEISESLLPSPVRDALKITLLSVEELIGNKEKEAASVKTISVPSEQIISGSMGIDSHKCEQIVDDLLDTFFKCNVVKSHIFHQKFVEIFQTLPMKTMLLHKINIYINDSINSTNKLKFIVALVHSIEYLGNGIFPYVRHAGENISFVTYLSQVFPLQNSHQMEICFRFAVEYMHYAEAHFLNLKHILPDAVMNTVPSALIKKYLYLSKRYTFAEEYNLKEFQKYRSNNSNPDLWNPLLMKSEMSFREWFKQEASVIPFEDFLSSRHEYLMNIITESSIFDSTNVINVATEVLHNVYSMDCSRDKYSVECGVITDEAWKTFHQDILQVLSMLLENFPLVVVGDVQSWLLQEWLKLQNIPKNNINFFRIVCILPPWLLYCNSRVDVPSENTVQAVGKFVMSHLKNVLCDENGFLHAALIRYLLSGVSMTVAHNRVVGAFLFNLLFESCPALIVASRVQVSIVLPIIKKFNDICSEATSILKHLLKTLPLIKLSSSDVMSKDMTMVSHWEVALDAWLENKPTCAFDSQVYRWIFFYNVLELGTQLQNGIISCKFDAESLSFCYSNVELIPVNITTVLIAELEKDISIIDTLDVILHEKHLPFCGLSELSQNLLSIAGLLLLVQYNTVKSNETNKFLSSSSNATMLCKVLLSNFTKWIKADSPIETYSLKREQKKKNLSPLVNADLLMNARSLLYALLTTVILKQNVTVPTVYFEEIGDVVIDNIFES